MTFCGFRILLDTSTTALGKDNTMTSTLLTTWTRLVGSTLEEGYDLDSNRDLDLSDDARSAMNADARDRLIGAANEFLAAYGAHLFANGEIILNLDADALAWDDDAEDAFREMLADVDYDDILDAV